MERKPGCLGSFFSQKTFGARENLHPANPQKRQYGQKRAPHTPSECFNAYSKLWSNCSDMTWRCARPKVEKNKLTNNEKGLDLRMQASKPYLIFQPRRGGKTAEKNLTGHSDGGAGPPRRRKNRAGMRVLSWFLITWVAAVGPDGPPRRGKTGRECEF